MTEPFLLDNDRIKVKDNQNQLPNSMWQGVDFGPGTSYSWYLEDFMTYVAADWTVTETDAAATQALATAAPCVNGVLLITNVDADNNLVSMQKVGHSFTPTAGSNIYFESRFQVNTATQVDIVFGLIATDTDPVTSIADGLIFRKDDGDTYIDFQATNTSTSSVETEIATFAADTYVTVGFKVTGISLVEFYVNGVKKGELTTNIPTVPLRVTMAFQDGDTGAAVGAQTMSIDYVKVAQTRL